MGLFGCDVKQIDAINSSLNIRGNDFSELVSKVGELNAKYVKNKQAMLNAINDAPNKVNGIKSNLNFVVSLVASADKAVYDSSNNLLVQDAKLIDFNKIALTQDEAKTGNYLNEKDIYEAAFQTGDLKAQVNEDGTVLIYKKGENGEKIGLAWTTIADIYSEDVKYNKTSQVSNDSKPKFEPEKMNDGNILYVNENYTDENGDFHRITYDKNGNKIDTHYYKDGSYTEDYRRENKIGIGERVIDRYNSNGKLTNRRSIDDIGLEIYSQYDANGNVISSEVKKLPTKNSESYTDKNGDYHMIAHDQDGNKIDTHYYPDGTYTTDKRQKVTDGLTFRVIHRYDVNGERTNTRTINEATGKEVLVYYDINGKIVPSKTKLIEPKKTGKVSTPEPSNNEAETNSQRTQSESSQFNPKTAFSNDMLNDRPMTEQDIKNQENAHNEVPKNKPTPKVASSNPFSNAFDLMARVANGELTFAELQLKIAGIDTSRIAGGYRATKKVDTEIGTIVLSEKKGSKPKIYLFDKNGNQKGYSELKTEANDIENLGYKDGNVVLKLKNGETRNVSRTRFDVQYKIDSKVNQTVKKEGYSSIAQSQINSGTIVTATKKGEDSKLYLYDAKGNEKGSVIIDNKSISNVKYDEKNNSLIMTDKNGNKKSYKVDSIEESIKIAQDFDGKNTGKYYENRGQKVVDVAKSAMGTPYVWGGCSPDGYDCSGLVAYALTGKHERLGATYEWLANPEVWTPTDNPQPGDVCLSSYHTGIYIGDGQMIHAPDFGEVVKIGPVQSDMIYVKYNGS